MNSLTTHFAAASLATLLALTSFAAQAAPPYRIIDLGAGIEVTALNDRGQVTGSRVTPSADGSQSLYGAFVVTPGIGLSLLDPFRVFGNTFGRAINDGGQVAGEYEGGDPRSLRDGFRYTPGSGFAGLSSGGYSVIAALGINSSGQITGQLSGPGVLSAYVNDPRTGFTVLHPDALVSGGTAINDAGQVAGQVLISLDNGSRAFVYDSSSGSMLLPGTHLGSAINNNGQVAGQTQNEVAGNIYNEAFLYTPGAGVSLLGTLGLESSSARGINDAGDVVGTAFNRGRGGSGFLYTRSGSTVDLDSLLSATDSAHWDLVGPRDINNRGWITGDGFFDGEVHGFLAVPVPEPHTYALMLGGLVVLAWRVRRRIAAAN